MLFVPMKPVHKYKAKIFIIWLLAFTSNILIFGLFIRHKFAGMANRAFWSYINEVGPQDIEKQSHEILEQTQEFINE